MSWCRSVRLWLANLARASRKGQAIVWTAVMLPLFLAVVGLAADGGLVFAARRELQNVADSAARAGAQQVDLQTYRESRGRSVSLDTSAARRAATEYSSSQGSNLDIRVEPDSQHVRVQVTRDAPTAFLRLVGISTVRVSASATAVVRHGIERGEP